MYLKILVSLFLMSQSFGTYCRDLRQFSAPINNSLWVYSGSKQQCTLEHEIPNYGRLSVSVNSGEEESSKLKLYYNRGIKFDRAELYFGRPNWQPNSKVRDGWFFQFPGFNEEVEFSARQTRQLLDNLNDGLQPIINHLDNTDRTIEVLASISTVMFKSAYDDYQTCVTAMLPVSWWDVRNSEVYFENGSVRLDDKTKTWLNYVLDYAFDSAVRRIELNGFTDSVGNYRDNHQLASTRVEMVRNYLVNAGFDERKIRLKVNGEQGAKYDNFSPAGRAKNRRVSIKIYR